MTRFPSSQETLFSSFPKEILISFLTVIWTLVDQTSRITRTLTHTYIYLACKNEANSLDAGMYWITRFLLKANLLLRSDQTFSPINNKEQSELHDDHFHSAHVPLLSEKQSGEVCSSTGWPEAKLRLLIISMI